MTLADRLVRIPNRPIIWLATAVHLVIGVGLILDPRVSLVTGLRFITTTWLNPSGAGLLFLASALAGVWALAHEYDKGPSVGTFWALIPQQMLLFIMAAGAIYAVIQGHYASGTILPRSFIFVDQFPKIGLAALHPFGVLRMHYRIFPESVKSGEYRTTTVTSSVTEQSSVTTQRRGGGPSA